MKNPPDHIESVTCEDKVTCAMLSPGFFYAGSNISERRGGRPTFRSSNKLLTQMNLHQLLEDWSLYINYEDENIRFVQPPLSQIIYLF